MLFSIRVCGMERGSVIMATIETTPVIKTEAPAPQPSSRITTTFQDAVRLLRENRKMLVGFCIVAFFLLLALFGPLFIHSDPYAFSADTLKPGPEPGS